MSRPIPEFRLRLIDHFGDPERWPRSFNNMLVERTTELLHASPPVRRVNEGYRHGDNGLDLNFTNRGLVQDLIDYYDSLVRSFAGLEEMGDQEWAVDLRRWNRERIQEGQRPLQEAIIRARMLAERDLAVLRRILIDRHGVRAAEAGPSGTNTGPARGRSDVADDHLSNLDVREDARGQAGTDYLPLNELPRQLAETLQVEDGRRIQTALDEASRLLAANLQREEDRRNRQAQNEASRWLAERLQEEEIRDRRAREQASRRLAAGIRRQEEQAHQRMMDAELRRPTVRLRDEGAAEDGRLMEEEARLAEEIAREEMDDYMRMNW